MTKKNFFLIIILLLSFLTLRFMYFYSNQASFIVGQNLLITTRIISEPVINGRSQTFRIFYKGKRITVKTSSFPRYSYGQKISLNGSLDIKTYPKKPEILTLSFPKIIVNTETNILLILIYNIRQSIAHLFERALTARDASLLLGIVFGIRRNFDQSFLQALQSAGVMHVIAASGMNVTMVAGALLAIFSRFLSRRKAIIISLIGLVIYDTIAGFEPSIVRASFMAGFAFLGSLLGKQRFSLYLLFLTAYLMLFIQPGLVFDLGFQLSFFATAGIMLIKPLFSFLEKGKIGSLIGEDFSTTLSAQIMTLPFLMSAFGSVNLLSVFINACILWTVPILMVIGGIAACIGLVAPPLAVLILYTAVPFLRFFETVVIFFSRFPLWMKGEMPGVLWIGYFCLIFAIIIFNYIRKHQR